MFCFFPCFGAEIVVAEIGVLDVVGTLGTSFKVNKFWVMDDLISKKVTCDLNF